MGLGQAVHREQLDSGLPEDLYEEFHTLSAWARTLPAKFGERVSVRLIDVVSVEGFFKSLLRRFTCYPAFTVDGARYAGSDFSRVDRLISERLTARRLEAGGR